MSENDEWVTKQLQPENMFVKATRWIDIIKTLGTGNAAGFAAAGAATTSFDTKHNIVASVKIAGCSFFVGIVAFALAYAAIQAAVETFDDSLQGIRNGDADEIKAKGDQSIRLMNRANTLAMISGLAFFVGLFFAVIAFLKS